MPWKPTRITLLSLLPFVLTLIPQAASASPRLLVDVGPSEVLFSEQSAVSWHPASLTKLMTAYLAFKAIRSGELDSNVAVTISDHAAAAPPSKLGIPAGSAIRIEDALAIMLTRSMNDVATAIAETVAGSEKTFVERMNSEASLLGMRGTHFMNASGLPNRLQVSTAEDLAILAVRILKEFPERRWMFGIPELSVAGRVLKNTNGLVGQYDGLDGMKTGYVCGSGFNVISTATRDNRQLVAVILGAPSAKSREKAAARLLDYGFQARGHGTTLTSNATEADTAADMTRFGCGKTYPGFSTALPTQPEAVSPIPTVEERRAPVIEKAVTRVRRF